MEWLGNENAIRQRGGFILETVLPRCAMCIACSCIITPFLSTIEGMYLMLPKSPFVFL